MTVRPFILSAIAAAAGAGGVAERYFANVLDRNPSGVQAASGSRTRIRGRKKIIIGSGDRDDLVFGFQNWSNGSPVVVRALALESPTAQVFPVTISGGRTGTVAANSLETLCDPVLPSTYGLSTFVRGSVWWLNYELDTPAAVASTNSAGGNQYIYDPATTTPKSVDVAGQITFTGADWNSISPAAIFVIGKFSGAVQPVWLGIGDSIMWGTGEALGVTTGLYGWFQNGLIDADGVSNAVAGYCQGTPGQSTVTFNSVMLAQLTPVMKYANRALEEFGTNDAGSSGTTVPAATILSRVQAIWSALNAEGITAVHRTKLLQRTASTDNWATEANQNFAANPGWAAGQNVSQFNDLLAAQVGTGIAGLLAFPSTQGVDPSKWSVNGTAKYSCDDGLHPSTAFHRTVMAAEWRAYRQSAA